MTDPMQALDFTTHGDGGAPMARRVYARAQATHLKRLPQIVLIARALAGAGRSVDAGLPEAQLTAALPLKAERQVENLEATLREDAGLADRVVQVLERYREAAGVLATAEQVLDGAQPEAVDLEALKQAAFFFSRFHELVKDDPLLSQLFPAPQLLEANAEDAASAFSIHERAGQRAQTP